MAAAFFRHILRRYGRQQVSGWIFEVSTDRLYPQPCHYYENSSWFDIYCFFWKTIKTAIPEAEVGGPTDISEDNRDFLKTFLKCADAAGCRPDFVSLSLFPYCWQMRNGRMQFIRSVDEQQEEKTLSAVKNILHKIGMDSLKLYATEWNMSLSNRNFLNDSCCRASYLVKHLTQIHDQVDRISLWFASDWSGTYTDIQHLANGGAGLVTKDCIPKPVFFAMQFMNALGDRLISRGANYILTASRNGDYYLLLFNCRSFSSSYYLQAENISDPRQIDSAFSENPPLRLKLRLKNMPSDGVWYIKRRRISRTEGSFLFLWSRFQYEDMLSFADLHHLRDICLPELSMTKGTAGEHVLNLNISLSDHEVSLLHIYPAE